MDRTTLNTRLERIQNEISKLVNTLYALNLTDSDTYPQNYEELSTDAALRAEKIACTLRNLIYSANLVPKPILMQKAADIQGITVTQIDCHVVITFAGIDAQKEKRFKPCFYHRTPLSVSWRIMPAPTLCVVSTSVLCAFHTSTTKINLPGASGTMTIWNVNRF